jgi:hypothetical protein
VAKIIDVKAKEAEKKQKEEAERTCIAILTG